MTAVRAAVHVHSRWSFDGHLSLDRIVKAFRRRGYRAVLTAEHCQSLDEDAWGEYRRACAALSTRDFLVVPGIEYRDADNVVHIPTWGDLPHLGDGLHVGRLLGEVSARGGVAVWAHPGRREAHRHFDPSWADLVQGIEVWNRKYDGWQPSPVGTELAQRYRRPGIASLDFHRRRQFFPLATVLDVSHLSVDGVVDALREERFEARFARRPVSAWSRGPSRGLLQAADAARTSAAAAVRRVRAD